MKTISSKIRMFKKPEIKAEEEKIYQEEKIGGLNTRCGTIHL
jgi:hypothetical protein